MEGAISTVVPFAVFLGVFGALRRWRRQGERGDASRATRRRRLQTIQRLGLAANLFVVGLYAVLWATTSKDPDPLGVSVVIVFTVLAGLTAHDLRR